MNSSEKEKLRRRLAAQHFLENISLDGSKQLPKNYAKKIRSISENNSKLKLIYLRCSAMINVVIYTKQKKTTRRRSTHFHQMLTTWNFWHPIVSWRMAYRFQHQSTTSSLIGNEGGEYWCKIVFSSNSNLWLNIQIIIGPSAPQTT